MSDNKYQREILSKCSFFPSGAKYSELAIKDIDDDLFNYHLQQLVKVGLLSKNDKIYILTEKGKSLVTNIDEVSKEVPPKYKVSVYMCVVNDDSILLHRRLKHPQFGYVGLPSGKIAYGERILDTANREFNEETHLDTTFQIIGNLRQIRRNASGQVIEDGVFYVCFANKFTGTLQESFQEGENFWCKINEVGKIEKLFKPSVEIIINEITKRLVGQKRLDDNFIYELEPEPEAY
jgi:ADP-ribose pyrophosphatase YjhB (NUDIX family)